MRFKIASIISVLLIGCIVGVGCTTPHSSNINTVADSGSSTPDNISTTQDSNFAPVRSDISLPSQIGYVNDYANILDDTTRNSLERTLNELKQRSEIEFAVVTLDTTGEHLTFDYSLALARGWGVGPRDTNVGGGLLLLIAVRDRRWHIQVSRNLESDLPDDIAAELGGRMTAPFQQGKYNEAITACVQSTVARLAERRGFTVSNVP